MCATVFPSRLNLPISQFQRSFLAGLSTDKHFSTNDLLRENETAQVVLITFIKSRFYKENKRFQGKLPYIAADEEIKILINIYICSFPVPPNWACNNCKLQMQTSTPTHLD